MRLKSLAVFVLGILAVVAIAITVSARSFAASSAIPDWLQAHVGDGDGEISQVVLERARALYQNKVSQGAVHNGCYFAMDATRPGDLGGGALGRRYYVICEAKQSFRAISSGHGGGRNLKGVVDFSNGKRCAKNFGNALDSSLTMGGAYMTSEAKTSFKGFYRVGAKQDQILQRTFIQFDGEGETANARQRVIGGHAARLLRGMCLRKKPNSSYADHDGFVPYGKLVDYAGGRSNGCTSWAPADADQIISMVKAIRRRSTSIRNRVISRRSANPAPIGMRRASGRSASRNSGRASASSQSSRNTRRTIRHRHRSRRRSARIRERCDEASPRRRGPVGPRRRRRFGRVY